MKILIGLKNWTFAHLWEKAMVRAAFTLAEVLITLGIIGIVAAMTIPNLIYNYQKKVWVNQLKSTHAILTQGFKRILADDNTTDLTQTELFLNMEKPECIFYLDSDGNKQCEEQFLTGLSKYFKFTPVSDQHYVLKRLNGEIYHVADGNMLLFLNGSAMIAASFSKESGSYRPCNEINQEGGHLCESPIWLRIDVNGLKGPNTLGRDVFEFIVGEDGIVYPNYGKEQSIYYGKPEYYWKNNDYYCSKSKNSSGLGCAGRVMEGNWAMDY